ncbi:MAG: caspase family protein [Planctomycetes bacterium]|nr:caspase family protein [Planctomycetota bacterium]
MATSHRSLVPLAAVLLAIVAAACGQTAPERAFPASNSTPAAPAGAPTALALLVGIDAYAATGRPDAPPPLAGAVNDVARARSVLIERFGFEPGHIVVLTGAAATHEAIVRTFQRHLIDQADAATRVVFWFSGHGSRVPDASHRDGSPRAVGENPFDETLVAYDSRAVDPDGGYDLTDDELYSLLAALPAKDVVVVTDCCHSGGVLRGGAPAPGVRECAAGTAPLARSRVEAFWPPGVPLRDDTEHDDLPAVVQVAACGADEEAGEMATAVGTFGTLTWFLSQALGEVDSRASWGEVAALVRARVAGLGTRPGQRVQIVGDAGRAVFGGRGRPVPSGYQVDRHGSRTVCVGAGSLHGLAEGAELQLLDLDGKQLGTARVERVRTTTCVAEWRGDGDLPGIPMRAVPTTIGRGQPRLRIAVDGVDGDLLAGSAVATVVAADADYVLRANGEQLGLFDRGGLCVRSMAPDRAALELELVREQRFRTLWEGIAAPGRFELEMAIEPVTAAQAAAKGIEAARLQPARGRGSGGVTAVVGAPPLGKDSGGGLLWLSVTNTSDADLYVAVVSATETREVNVLIGNDENNLVRAHDSVQKLILLGPTEGWPTEVPMVDRYIAIGTTRFADFRPFTSAATVGTTRGASSDELPPFLRAVLGAGRTRGDMDAPAWGIASCDLRLVTPALFDATQPR